MLAASGDPRRPGPCDARARGLRGDQAMMGLSMTVLALSAAMAQVAVPRDSVAAIPAQEGASPHQAPPPPPAPVIPAGPAAAPLPPQDWSALPVLRFRRPVTPTTESTAFVAGQVSSGQCSGAARTRDGWQLTIDLALFATADGRIRRVTPRAIDCPTVEQYAAGLLLGAARDNIDLRGAAGDIWYRTTMTFGWKA